MERLTLYAFKKLFFSILFCVLPTNALYAGEKNSPNVHLTCSISSAFDEKSGTTSPTTGLHGLIIKTTKDGNIRIETDQFDASYVGTVNATTYYGTVNFSLQNGDLDVCRWVEISRITGEYKNGFAINGKPGLVFFGRCSRVENLF